MFLILYSIDTCNIYYAGRLETFAIMAGSKLCIFVLQRRGTTSISPSRRSSAGLMFVVSCLGLFEQVVT